MPRLMIDGDHEDYRGFRINVKHDPDPENPRGFCNISTIWQWHHNYTSPDETPRADPWEALVDLFCNHSKRPNPYQHLGWVFTPDTMHARYDPQIEDIAYAMRCNPDKAFAKLAEVAILSPLYMFEHSGRAWSMKPFSCRWDSGQVGWIFVTLDKVRAEYGKRITAKVRAMVIEAMEIELRTYAEWAEGEVYGYTVTELPVDEEPDYMEVLESCWGFYGMNADASGLWEMATNAVDCLISYRATNRAARLKTLIRNRVPLDKRAAELGG